MGKLISHLTSHLSHQADLGDRRVVSPKAGAEAAAALGLQYFESSAKDQTGVEVRIGQNRDFIHYFWQAVPNVKPVLLYFSTQMTKQVILRSDAIPCLLDCSGRSPTSILSVFILLV